MKVIILLLLPVIVIFASGCIEQQNSAKPEHNQTVSESKTNTIIIKDFDYDPFTLKIKAGAVIIWMNEDSYAHTVTAKGHTSKTKGLFDSGTLSKGQSFSYTFKEAGTFEYYCAIHPSMIGKIEVEN